MIVINNMINDNPRPDTQDPEYEHTNWKSTNVFVFNHGSIRRKGIGNGSIFVKHGVCDMNIFLGLVRN